MARTRASQAQNKNKTVANDRSVAQFLGQVEPARRQADARILLELFEAETGESARMWGPSIIGFGQYHYRYDSGREGDSMKTGFAPRKAALVLYIMPGFESSAPLRESLGKYRIGKSCLYINKLDDIDLAVLRQIVRQGYEEMARRYDCNKS